MNVCRYIGLDASILERRQKLLGPIAGGIVRLAKRNVRFAASMEDVTWSDDIADQTTTAYSPSTDASWPWASTPF